MDIAAKSEAQLHALVRLATPPPALADELRTPLHYHTTASDDIAELPPLVLRPPGPTLPDALLEEQLRRFNRVAQHDYATAEDSLVDADDEIVTEVLDLLLALHASNAILRDVPLHSFDILVCDHKAASLLDPQGATLLEKTAACVAELAPPGLRLSFVGSSLRYLVGTTLVEDDHARIYPDDRTLSRAVVNVPHCRFGDASVGAVDRAVLGLLLVLDEGTVVIKSLADVISTVYNAVLVAQPDEIARFRGEQSPGIQVVTKLSRHPDARVAATFSVVLDTLRSVLDGRIEDANKTFFLAHAVASAREVLESGGSADSLIRFFATSLVVSGLRSKGVAEASVNDLPRGADLVGSDVELVFSMLNAQLSEEPDCFRLSSAESSHAAVDLVHNEMIEQDTVTVQIGRALELKNNQYTLLGSERTGSKTFKVEQGDMKGVQYSFSFRDGQPQVLRSTNCVSHFCRRVLHPLGRLGTPQVAMVTLPVEKIVNLRVEASEAVNECLAGRCGTRAARWVLSKIYSKTIRVSDRSTATYIPSFSRVSEETSPTAPVVTALLDRTLASEMACLAPASLDALYMVLHTDAEVMKVKIRGNTLYLNEDRDVDIAEMRKGVLSSNYTIG